MIDEEIKKLWIKQIKVINKEFENKTKYLYKCETYFLTLEIDVEFYSDPSYLFTYLEKVDIDDIKDIIISQYKNELGKFIEIRRYYYDNTKGPICELL